MGCNHYAWRSARSLGRLRSAPTWTAAATVFAAGCGVCPMSGCGSETDFRIATRSKVRGKEESGGCAAHPPFLVAGIVSGGHFLDLFHELPLRVTGLSGLQRHEFAHVT